MLLLSKLLPWVLALLHCCHLSVAFLNCGKCTHGHSLLCPSYSDKQFELQIKAYDGKPDVFLQIECDDLELIDFSLLEGCNFSSVSYVSFKFCPIFNETFEDTFNKIGIYPGLVKYLRLYYPDGGISILEEDHLIGLNNLTYLNIEMAKFTNIKENAFQHTPNLEKLYIRGNNFTNLSENTFKNLFRLKILNLSNNNLNNLPEGLLDDLVSLEFIYFWANKLETVPTNLFYSLTELKNVSFLSNNLLSINEDLFMNNVNLQNVNFNRNKLKNIPENIFANNSRIDVIKFSGNELTTVPELLFNSNNLLTTIELENNLIETLPEFIFKSLNSLNILKLSNNSLQDLPKLLLQDNINLEILYLDENSIKNLSSHIFKYTSNLKILNMKNNSLSFLTNNIFSNCLALEELNLSHNNLTSISFNSFPYKSSLKKVDLSHNQLNTDGIITTFIFALNAQINLEDMDMSFNEFTDFPVNINLFNFLHLKNLNFEGNRIRWLELSILFEMANNSFINLKNNRIETIRNSKIFQPKTINAYLSGNNLTCDCHNFDLIEKMNMKTQNINGILNVLDKDELVCQRPEHLNNKSIIYIDLIELECKMRPEHCTHLCPCILRKYDNMIIVKCSEHNLDRVPDINIIPQFNYTFDLSKNLISSFNLSMEKSIVNLSLNDNQLVMKNILNEVFLPPNLKTLDLRKNNLTFISEQLLSQINGSGAKVYLNENPWVCDCQIKDLHNFIQAEFSKVDNVREIYCEGFKRPLIDLTEEDICPLFQQPIILTTIGIITAVLILFAILATVTFYKYKTSIKVWLYTHRCCLCLVTEDELDVDKEYDAFISFSHKDEDFIDNILLPGLERGDPPYKICIHHRDWTVGEFIQNQIMNSVQNSRRTIVVLSNNFIESVWGQMEFRAAHQQALQDKTNRVIVILYGEMPLQELIDEELRHYISLHTYLKWGHPKFWEHLRYAMPHPKHLLNKKKRDRKINNKIELVNGHIK